MLRNENEFKENDSSNEDERKPSYERVVSSQMQGTGITEINENNVYLLGFARKSIVSLAPFTHSAAAFLDINAQDQAKWLIFGRQTPFFLKSTTEEGRGYTACLTRFFQKLTVHNLMDSQIKNEKNYKFFPKHNFEVEKTSVALSGSEVKQILQRANAAICSNNYDFNLVQSNCYSASVEVLACAIEVINDRMERNKTEHAKNDRSIGIIRELLTHATQDNFGIGVITHPVVLNHLVEVDRIITKRRLSNLEDRTLESENPDSTNSLRC